MFMEYSDMEGGVCIFLFENAWKYIAYHKYNSVILLIAIVWGGLFPLLAVNDINDVIRDGEVSRYEDASRVVVIEYMMEYRSEAEIEEAISRCQEKELFETAGYAFSQNEIVYVDDESYTCGICSISESYLHLAGCELISGEFLSPDDYAAAEEKVCLLGTRGALVEDGVRVGDVIEIAGENYRVKGIVRAPRSYGSVLVPYADTADLFSVLGTHFQYQIITYGEDQPNPGSLARSLFRLDDGKEGLIEARTGAELEEIYYDSIWKVNRYRILRAAIVVVLASISLLLLFAGIILREKKDMAVRIALGGSRTMLWLESVIRNLMLVLSAFCITLLLYPGISKMVMGTGSRLLFRTVLQVGISITVLVVLIDSIVFFVGFRRRNVVQTLKE